jgi:tRNA-modifying protein YgfZ
VPEFADCMPDLAITPLDDLTVLAVRGTDAVNFLQGQVSNDLTQLATRGAMLAGLHNPQGRCLALLRLVHLGNEQILAVLPAELAPAIKQQLGRYVLRAKVKLEDASAAWRIYGASGPDADAAASTRLHMPMDGSGMRQLIIAPRSEPLPDGEPDARESWRLADIQAGLPEILTATTGHFVAQMLNLDCIDAISLTKGCYTGQEVVARAHYRGQVKRRMQRFFSATEATLQPGARVQLDDGRSAQVVMAAAAEGGGQEFLAVTALRGAAVVPERAEPVSGGETPATWTATQLGLPYSLPS